MVTAKWSWRDKNQVFLSKTICALCWIYFVDDGYSGSKNNKKKNPKKLTHKDKNVLALRPFAVLLRSFTFWIRESRKKWTTDSTGYLIRYSWNCLFKYIYFIPGSPYTANVCLFAGQPLKEKIRVNYEIHTHTHTHTYIYIYIVSFTANISITSRGWYFKWWPLWKNSCVVLDQTHHITKDLLDSVNSFFIRVMFFLISKYHLHRILHCIYSYFFPEENKSWISDYVSSDTLHIYFGNWNRALELFHIMVRLTKNTGFLNKRYRKGVFKNYIISDYYNLSKCRLNDFSFNCICGKNLECLF